MDKETKELLETLAKDRSVQVNINCSDVSFIKVPESVPHHEPRMPAASKMTRERFSELYRLLTGDNNYINPALSLDGFLYWFGINQERPADLQPIEWLAPHTKQQALVLVKSIYATELNNKSLMLKTIKDSVLQCFTYKGEPLALSNNCEEFSIDIDRLEDFFRPS